MGDYNEIIARFDRYGFVDIHGHKLVMCLEFQLLVEQAVTDHERVRELERVICERGKHKE